MPSDGFDPQRPPKAAITQLADEVVAAADGHTGRYLLGVAGSPGSGKTTLAKALVKRINKTRPGVAAYLPMDGFHLANATLDRLEIHDRKGAIDTFDAWGFLALLSRVRAEVDHTVYAPSFRREVDEGVAGELAVEPSARIIIVEGNYLLVDRGPWAQVKDRLNAAWFTSTPQTEREARLIDRHTRHGRTVQAATDWARNVDGVNAVLIETSAARADRVLSGITGEPVTTAASRSTHSRSPFDGRTISEPSKKTATRRAEGPPADHCRDVGVRSS